MRSSPRCSSVGSRSSAAVSSTAFRSSTRSRRPCDVRSRRRPRSLRRARPRPGRTVSARSRAPRARGAVRGRRLPSRAAALRAGRNAFDRRDRHGETRRQDRRHRARGSAARPREARRRGRDGPWRAARARARHRSADVADLLARSRAGRHAASDHLETAAVTGLRTVGCRRCGGGLAGAVGISNVVAGVRLAEELVARPAASRRQRRGDPADRGRPPHPRRRSASGPRRLDGVSQPLPGAARRPGPRHDGGGRYRACRAGHRARRARPGPAPR